MSKLSKLLRSPITFKDWVLELKAKGRAWVAATLPGLKTRFVAGLGALGMAAGYFQEYVSGLPLGEFIDPKTVSLIGGLLFTLAYWFRGMGNKG